MELRGQDMRCRRIVGFLVGLSLAMSGSVLGSEPEIRLQARWSELKQLLGRKKVALQLSDGARVEGRVKRVTDPSLVLKVKKSSEPADYPKGKIEIRRETISRIEVRGLKASMASKARQVGATVGTFAGTLFGSMAAIYGLEIGEDSKKLNNRFAVSVAIATTAAIAVNRSLASKEITLIEILPDPPGEQEPKPTNKDQSSNTTVSGEALAASLIEESSAERLRRQSRRAVMRQDLPLDLSSLPCCFLPTSDPLRQLLRKPPHIAVDLLKRRPPTIEVPESDLH